MKRFFYVGLFSCLLVACNPDKDTFTPNPIFSEGFVTTNISGQILDVMNQPVEGAIIRLDGIDRTSDANGVFYFKNAQVDSKRAILNVNKDGFFEGGRAIFPTKESNVSIKIQLLEKIVVANFDGSVGGEIALPDNCPLPVAIGTVAGAYDIDKEQAVTAYLHAFTSNQIQCALRLMKLGQQNGVWIQKELENRILETAERAASSTLDDLGSATIGAEIAAMRHETMNSRIFRS